MYCIESESFLSILIQDACNPRSTASWENIHIVAISSYSFHPKGLIKNRFNIIKDVGPSESGLPILFQCGTKHLSDSLPSKIVSCMI